jgi:hypothetical protein
MLPWVTISISFVRPVTPLTRSAVSAARRR